MTLSILNLNDNPEVAERLKEVLALAATDKAFRFRLIREPKAVLREIGVTVPAHMVLSVHDTPRGAVGITLPAPRFED